MNVTLLRKTDLAALSLVEMMVAMSIGSMLMIVILSLSSYTARSFAAISNYVALDRASRNALDRITMMIRESDGVTGFATNRVEFSYHSAPLSYMYSPVAKTLVETLDGKTRILLTDCNSLTFSIFQRNQIGGSYDQYPAALDQNAAKIVQVSWLCSRRLLGAVVNTESIQSGKIVIRKQ